MKRLSIFALGLLLCIGTIVNAQQTDNKSQDWNSGGTWKGGGVPDGTSTVSIVNGNNVSLAGTGQAASLAISRGSLSINGGTLTTTTTNGTTISGGTLTNSGTISGNVSITSGTLTNSGAINGNVSITSGTLTNSGAINGNLTIGGGVVNINQGSSITGTITINEGTVNIAAGAVVDFSGATISESATVNITDGAVLIGYPGKQSISIPLTAGKWNFIGFPHVENISPLAADDAPAIWALAFDYGTNQWTENYLHWIDGVQHDALPCGQGIFAWPANDYTITASSVVTNENRTMTYSSTAGSNENGRWFALANPFSFPLDITKFLDANPGIIQGGCVYKYNGSTFDENVTSGTIKVGQGFFVNMASNDGQIQFNNNQYSTSTAKSKSAEREFVRVSVSTEGYKVPVMFAQNDDASDGYDIYDANKMFGDGSVAEPYLICNGINLCKEEVSSTNYTATMNIKSFESRNVDIVADNIPEGYSLTLIDGAVEMEMSEGDVYTTDIAEGENADRFKLLITKNNVSIADVAEAESIRVVNNNRIIRVYGGKSVRTEVYNALGQKVYETSDRAFDLNNVASGAYVLRVQDGKSVNSAKIVVE
ncbi:MAG: T9SS type A sorting domain-containing protein [Candidatus Onthomorpha sp.]